jgi:hypothetical protein
MASRMLDISAGLTGERTTWCARMTPDGSSATPRSQGAGELHGCMSLSERFSE